MIVKNSVKVRLRLYSAGCCQPPHSRLGRTCRARCGHGTLSWSPLNTRPRLQLVDIFRIYFSPIVRSRNDEILMHGELKTILLKCHDKVLEFIFLFQYQNINLWLKIADMYGDLNLLIVFLSCSDF